MGAETKGCADERDEYEDAQNNRQWTHHIRLQQVRKKNKPTIPMGGGGVTAEKLLNGLEVPSNTFP